MKRALLYDIVTPHSTDGILTRKQMKLFLTCVIGMRAIAAGEC